jgi:protein-S-isoprenylcysteine O-methyltransferase Ste14
VRPVTPGVAIDREAKMPATHGVMDILATPAVDKTIAIVAVVPFTYALYLRLAAGTLNLPRACVAVSLLLTIVTMVLRRAPVRVTPNPLWWLLAFVATYGPLAWAAFTPAGRPVAPAGVTGTLAVLSVGIVIYARLSLGRNIGFVPAQRSIVRSGAYRFVRHPIYSGLFVAWAALTLRLFSPANLGILLTFYTLLVIKSIVEENFLRADPAYAQYLRDVKFRYVPGII